MVSRQWQQKKESYHALIIKYNPDLKDIDRMPAERAPEHGEPDRLHLSSYDTFHLYRDRTAAEIEQMLRLGAEAFRSGAGRDNPHAHIRARMNE